MTTTEPQRTSAGRLADDVNKLFVIPRVVNVSLAILSLVRSLSVSITQQYTMRRLPCVL